VKKRHGGWAAQAKRRKEEYLGCTECGMSRHPRQQAIPAEEVEEVRPLKIMGLAVWLICFYAVVIYFLPVLLESVR